MSQRLGLRDRRARHLAVAVVIALAIALLLGSASPAFAKRRTRFKGVASTYVIPYSYVMVSGRLQYKASDGVWRGLRDKYVRLYLGNGYGGWVYSVRVRTGAKGKFSFTLLADNRYRVRFLATTTYYGTSKNFSASRAWSAAHGNARRNGRTGFVGPAAYHRAWRFPVGDNKMIDDPVVARDGTIYITKSDVDTGQSTLYALNPSGTVKWYRALGIGGGGPTVGANGIVYLFAFDKVLAYRPNGTLLWSYTVTGGQAGSPVVGSNGTVYFTGSDSSHQYRVYAVSSSGGFLWSSALGSQSSIPSLGSDNTVYVGTSSNTLRAFSSSGAPKWTYTATGHINESPVVGSDGTIYFHTWAMTSADRAVYAVSSAGALKWRHGLDGYGRMPALGRDGTVYTADNSGSTNGHQLLALRPNGTVKWHRHFSEDVGSPIVDGVGRLYLSMVGGKFYALNPYGSTKWTTSNCSDRLQPPAIGRYGTLYVESRDGALLAFKR